MTCHKLSEFLSLHIQFSSRAEPAGGGALGGLPPPSLGSFKLEIMKGNKTITEAILSLNVVMYSVRSATHALHCHCSSHCKYQHWK